MSEASPPFTQLQGYAEGRRVLEMLHDLGVLMVPDEDILNGAPGVYRPGRKTIGFRPDAPPAKAAAVLLHEARHAEQDSAGAGKHLARIDTAGPVAHARMMRAMEADAQAACVLGCIRLAREGWAEPLEWTRRTGSRLADITDAMTAVAAAGATDAQIMAEGVAAFGRRPERIEQIEAMIVRRFDRWTRPAVWPDSFGDDALALIDRMPVPGAGEPCLQPGDAARLTPATEKMVKYQEARRAADRLRRGDVPRAVPDRIDPAAREARLAATARLGRSRAEATSKFGPHSAASLTADRSAR